MNYRNLAWPFGFYFFILAGMAAYRPFMVLYFQSLSFTGAQIGLLTGLAPLITLVSLPLMTAFADRTNRHKLVMGLSLVIMILGLILFPSITTFLPLFGLTILTTISFALLMSLASSASMFMLEKRKELFGRIRLGGTIGYSFAAILAGALVENYGLKFAFWGAAGLFFIAFIINQKLVHGEEVSETPVAKGRASELLRKPHFILFLVISFSGGISFATISTFLFPYMKELGAPESMMGLALTIGTIAEVPLLFFAGRFIRRYSAYTLLIFSLAMTSLRFLLLAIAPTPILVLFVQLLNGFNYPLLMVAGVTYADDHAPQGFRATAQGLFNASMGGVGAAIGGFMGGILFESMGAKGMYLSFSIFVIVVLLVVNLVRRILPPETETLHLSQSTKVIQGAKE